MNFLQKVDRDKSKNYNLYRLLQTAPEGCNFLAKGLSHE